MIAAFSDYLTDAQCQSDDLAELGEWVKATEANVVKLPNISASIPQLVACINELQAQGYLPITLSHQKMTKNRLLPRVMMLLREVRSTRCYVR